MNELMSNLQEALQKQGLDPSEICTPEEAREIENNFVDEIVPLQSLAKETQFSGK